MEPETQKQQENSANSSVGGIQPSTTATEIESNGNSTVKTDARETSEPSGEKQEAMGDCVIDVKHGGPHAGGGGGGGCETLRAEKVCRICHLSSENSSENSELIQLGCGCKDELGVSHLYCAQTWFKHKGNRECEICGNTAKNITGIQDARIFMVEWREMRLMRSPTNPLEREEGSCRCGKSFCNFLLACLVLAFVLPWFIRVDLS